MSIVKGSIGFTFAWAAFYLTVLAPMGFTEKVNHFFIFLLTNNQLSLIISITKGKEIYKMFAEVWYKEGLFEVNEALMNEMENKICDMSGNYCNYVLTCTWYDGHLYFDASGPWEC